MRLLLFPLKIIKGERKFILGLLVGSVLAFAATGYASSTIQAIFFPARIDFFVNSTDGKSVDGVSDSVVLNFDNKAYVPLRLFAESMGATVDYQIPTTDEDFHKIQIFLADDKQMNLHDPNDNISVGNLIVRFGDNKTNISGMVKLNKDFPNRGEGLRFTLEMFDDHGILVGSSIFTYVEHIAPGQVKAFYGYIDPLVYPAIDHYTFKIRPVTN